METLFLTIAEIPVRAQHDLHEAREIFFAEAFGYAGHSRALVGRGLAPPPKVLQLDRFDVCFQCFPLRPWMSPSVS